MNNLNTELKTYQKLLPSLLNDQGKFALIANEELLGVYSSYEDALKIGYAQCGVKPFLVKKIFAEEQTFYFTRDIGELCQA